MSNPHPVDIHVGKRLRLRRSMLGMSQEALGKATGITFQQIQKYERGINRIGSSRLFDFSNVLGISVSYFFEEFDDKKSANANVAGAGFAEGEGAEFEYEPMANKESIQLIKAFNKIQNPDVRKKIINLVKSLNITESV